MDTLSDNKRQDAEALYDKVASDLLYDISERILSYLDTLAINHPGLPKLPEHISLDLSKVATAQIKDMAVEKYLSGDIVNPLSIYNITDLNEIIHIIFNLGIYITEIIVFNMKNLIDKNE